MLLLQFSLERQTSNSPRPTSGLYQNIRPKNIRTEARLTQPRAIDRVVNFLQESFCLYNRVFPHCSSRATENSVTDLYIFRVGESYAIVTARAVKRRKTRFTNEATPGEAKDPWGRIISRRNEPRVGSYLRHVHLHPSSRPETPDIWCIYGRALSEY